MFKGKFNDIVLKDEGFLRGPFGSALKKSLFVPKSVNAYKVYEQSVVLEKNKNLGKYYISKEYFESKLKNFEVKSGDFLVSCSGVNYGEIYELEGKIEKGVINQALLRVRINEKIVDRNYFLYYFRAYIAKVITGGSGDSTIPNFPPMDFVKNVEVELPDLVVQRKIGRILKRIDKKYELNNHINNNLEELMKTIYQRWFIEFEFPNEEGKPYKSNGGKLAYNEELKSKIPENWKVVNINEISDFITGYAFTSDTYCNDGRYKLYTIKNVQDGNIVSNVDNTIEKLPFNLPYECILKPKDLIMSLTGNVGRVGLVYENQVLLNQRLLKIKQKNNLSYLYSLFRNDYIKNKCESISTGTSQKNLSPVELGKVKVAYSIKIVDKFEEKCSALIETFINNLEENQRLKSLKEFILPLLMNGQINVDDIEI